MRSRLSLAGSRSTRRAIRRLHARDPDFRSICDDYGLAQRALKHWEAVGQAAPGRVEEYREIVQELEAEVLAILQAFEGS